MTAQLIDREMFFRFRRTENDIARVRAIADKASADIQAETRRKRQKIERQLTTIISGCDWFDRMPSDHEPFSDGRT